MTFCKGQFLGHKPVFLILLSFLFAVFPSKAQQVVENDSTKNRIDSLNQRRLTPSFLLWQNMRTNPLFPSNNPFLIQRSPFLPQTPIQQQVNVQMDSSLRYHIIEQIDSTRIGNEQEYDFDEFSQIQEYRVRQDYWRSRARGMDGESAVEGRNLIPPLTVSPSFDRIFGGSDINITCTCFWDGCCGHIRLHVQVAPARVCCRFQLL